MVVWMVLTYPFIASYDGHKTCDITERPKRGKLLVSYSLFFFISTFSVFVRPLQKSELEALNIVAAFLLEGASHAKIVDKSSTYLLCQTFGPKPIQSTRIS